MSSSLLVEVQYSDRQTREPRGRCSPPALWEVGLGSGPATAWTCTSSERSCTSSTVPEMKASKNETDSGNREGQSESDAPSPVTQTAPSSALRHRKLIHRRA